MQGSFTSQNPPICGRECSVGSPVRTAASTVRRQPAHVRRRGAIQVQAYQVEIQHDGQSTKLEVEEGTTILDAALDSGLELSHDCKMGVCMTCPAKLVAGEVDQSAGMLDEDVKDKGYALLCVSEPTSDCTIRTIEEVLNALFLGPSLSSL